MDGENFTTVSTGNWENDEELKTVKFDAVEATHVRLIALKGVGEFASAAELNIKQKELPVEPEIIVNPVRDFKASEINKKNVTVTWTEPETTEGLEGYILYKDGKKVAEIGKDETSYTFKKLNRHTIYNFKIAAKYSNGEVSSKESLTLRTAR